MYDVQTSRVNSFGLADTYTTENVMFYWDDKRPVIFDTEMEIHTELPQFSITKNVTDSCQTPKDSSDERKCFLQSVREKGESERGRCARAHSAYAITQTRLHGHRHAQKQPASQAGRQTDRQTDRHTDREQTYCQRKVLALEIDQSLT